MLAKQVRYICPHCGAINRAPVRTIGRGGTCIRCNGGVKVPAAHGWAEETDHTGVLSTTPEPLEPPVAQDLIDQGFEASTADEADEGVELFDVGRPARASRSITAPSAVVADATLLPTASQLANSDRADRATLPPVQTMRSLRRFTRNVRPRRHIAARRQQPGTPWWAWLAHGTLSIGAMYALTWLYNGSFTPNVNAYAPSRAAMLARDTAAYETAEFDPLPDAMASSPTTLPAQPLALTDANGSPNTAAIASIVASAQPDERTWLRYEQILLPGRVRLYVVTRITQARDGRPRVDRAQTYERPADFPEDATIIDRRSTDGADEESIDD